MATDRDPSDDAEAPQTPGGGASEDVSDASDEAAAEAPRERAGTTPLARAADEDDDEDDGAREPASSAARDKKKVVRRRVTARPAEVGFLDPLAADRLDSPSKLTMGLIFALAALVLGTWVGAVKACNVQGAPPKRPQAISTDRLAGTPKDAAVELMLRWASDDAASALELAKEPLASALEKDRVACAANEAACAARREALTDKVFVSGNVLAQDAQTATVRVRLAPGGSQPAGEYLLTMEREGAIWKATQSRVDDGKFTPPARPAPAVEEGTPAPSSSAPATP